MSSLISIDLVLVWCGETWRDYPDAMRCALFEPNHCLSVSGVGRRCIAVCSSGIASTTVVLLFGGKLLTSVSQRRLRSATLRRANPRSKFFTTTLRDGLES